MSKVIHVVVICLALALAACEPEPPMEAPPKPKPAPAPKFQLDGLDGKPVALGDYAGKPLIVNFWATWCAPCIKEMPVLENFYHLKKGEGLELLMVNVKESRSVVEKFMRQNNFSLDVALDEDGKATDEFQVFGLPCTYFIDKNGVIQNRHMGSITKEILYAGYGDITGK
ncbi:MAG: TlpA family protein disulfide reductase [Nitrospinota bacterium]|nr:TlpA family protein disulfide reductase [Nitrospinota bacterium]MDH5756441.1 TlpA family protein disulfide reductase [Nitrospinota bacterium]